MKGTKSISSSIKLFGCVYIPRRPPTQTPRVRDEGGRGPANRDELGISRKIKMAAAWRSNLGKYVREIRIHLCQKSQSSQGVR